MDLPDPSTPVACDMTTARDTPQQRLAEYRKLFAEALVGRERTEVGIRFRFRADPGVEAWIRDLAEREKACCAFFAFTIAVTSGEVLWDAAVIDNDAARAILDEFYRLPETVAEGVEALQERYVAHGLEFVGGQPSGVTKPPGRGGGRLPR